MRHFCIAALVLCVSASAARADEPEIPFASITFSPLHLILPVFEVTAEFRVHPDIGVAAILGGGTIGPHLDPDDVLESPFVFEGGARFAWYAVGSFKHGMQVGLETLFAHISTSGKDISGFGRGLGITPFLGYKIAADSGFTFECQMGPVFGFVFAEATESSTGDSASASDTSIGLNINLNIGWSF